MTLPAETFEYQGKYIRIGFGRAGLSEALEVFTTYLEKDKG